jgi:hypothetical protein
MSVTLRCIAFAVVAVVTAAARAETWINQLPSSVGVFAEIDQDATRPAGDDRFDVTWRTGDSKDRPYWVQHGIVDCPSESVQMLTSTYIETDPTMRRINGGDLVTDYVAGTSTLGTRSPSALTESARAGAFEYPTRSSATGAVIRGVCRQPGQKEQREAVAREAQRGLGCTTAPTGDPMCGQDAATLDALDLLVIRLQQVQRACGLSATQVSALFTDWTGRVLDSARAKFRNPMMLIDMDASGLGKDLALVARNRPCRYVAQDLQAAEEHTRTRDALAQFQACVRRSVPALDDRISAADVVANGVLGACQAELPNDMAGDPGVARTLLSSLTAAVLEHRRAARR